MKLKRIYIEISNICNVQCSFCPKVERDNDVMSLEDFETIISQAAPLAEEVCLHLMGEPLAHPNFREIVSICEKYHAKFQLTTNGLLINRYKELLLNSSSSRQVNFSLQSFSDNFPHKPIGPYLTNILNFCLEASKVAPDMYQNLRLWNMETEDTDNEEIFKFVENYFNILIKRAVDVGSIKSKRIWNKLYLHFDSRFEWPSLDLSFKSKQGKCHGLVSHIGIHSNGTVVPCCLDKEAVLPLGNCLESKLEDILESARAVKMREGFKNGRLVEELCQKCSYITRFSSSSAPL
jgi:radical SAM protein with 4Fe4S-binding SPASM domain